MGNSSEPLSPQNDGKALNINDLEPYSFKKRDINETTALSDTSLYDALQELSERKKMYFLNPIPYLQYRTCKLCEGKEWYVFFYVPNPTTKRLKRVKIKVNRVKSVKERRKVARSMMAAIDARLALGWNPLAEAKSPKAFVSLFSALDSFLKIKSKETESNTMRS